MSIEVLYQDEFISAYLKPPSVHTVPGVSPGSFVELVKSAISQPDFCKDHLEAGFINRLDYETSGIILAAKSQEIFNQLRTLTKQSLIQKNYIFLSDNTISRKTACELSIGARGRKSDHVKAKLVTRDKDRPSPARTIFNPIASGTNQNIHLIEAVIYQGQRHQIRVHAKEIGCPLINDTKYSGSVIENIPGNIFILHNINCSFTHPVNNKIVSIYADIPDNICSFLKGLSLHYASGSTENADIISHIKNQTC